MNQSRRASDRSDSALARFAVRDVERLHSEQRNRDLLMHDRPVCSVARPHFVDKSELLRHRHVVNVLSNALRKARDHLIADRWREAEHLGR
jgi:stress-induced morphogen